MVSSQKYPFDKRKIVFITARVHAAEVTASFKAEGILSFLVSEESLAVCLRDLYIFKIVPILNPEGVLAGNFRTSIVGTDLNRRWDKPDEILHPQIYFLKNYMKLLISIGKEIFVYCDLHGHTRKNNAFIYGCNKAADGGFCSWTKVRLLPRILATKTPKFSYNDCGFRVEGDRLGTARVVVWKEFKVTNSFTFESSFFGYMRGDEITAYEVKDYYELGYSFLKALKEFNAVLRKLDKELIETNGWLKPSRLITITGALAADELAKKLAQSKKEENIKKRIMKVSDTVKKAKDTSIKK